MKTFYFSLAIVLLDQITKQFAIRFLELPSWLVFEKIGLRINFNDALVFSLPVSGWWAVALSGFVFLGLLWWYIKHRNPEPMHAVAFGLIFGGAFSNLFDRFFRGSVIDFIQVFWWPTFNVADTAITIGLLLLIVFSSRVFSSPRNHGL